MGKQKKEKKKRDLQKPVNPKKKKDKFIEIETFIRKITVSNSHENRVIRDLINSANQGNYSCVVEKMSHELYSRYTSNRIGNQTGIVKRPLRGRRY